MALKATRAKTRLHYSRVLVSQQSETTMANRAGTPIYRNNSVVLKDEVDET
jgi:hypothetical protein